MTTILEILVNTLIERFAAAGFDIPDDMTEEQRESFVFESLVNAAIVPADEHARLVAAARRVVDDWESARLAEAVRNLAIALPEETVSKPETEGQIPSDSNAADPNDTTKPKWHVEYATTVHAVSEEEALAMAEHDFAVRNCVTTARRY